MTITARVSAVGVNKLATSTAAVQIAQMQGATTRQRAKQQKQPMRAVAPETDHRAEAVALPAVSAAEASKSPVAQGGDAQGIDGFSATFQKFCLAQAALTTAATMQRGSREHNS